MIDSAPDLPVIVLTGLDDREVARFAEELEDQEFFAILDEVYRTGEPYHADEEPGDLDLGEGLERRYLSFVYQPLTGDDGVTGVLALGIHVTEQVEARQEASSHQRRLAQVLDTVADGILFTDPEGNFAYANPAAVDASDLVQRADRAMYSAKQKPARPGSWRRRRAKRRR